MRIPQFDLTRQDARIGAELRAALDRVLARGQFVLGPEGEAFEQECAAVLGVRHAVGVGSGSDALRLILQALGVGPGDEVITPAFSFISSATAILEAGARPVFADVEPGALTLDPAAVRAAVGPHTRAVIAVHLYGTPADLDGLRELCATRSLVLVEDAAQAFGARWQGRPVGGWGAAAGFSFYPTKTLGACGDAGLVATDDGALAARVRRLRNHGQAAKYEHVEPGWGSRLDELQAALLRVKLRHLPAWTAARRRIAARYTAGLRGCPLRLPVWPEAAEPVVHQYTVRTPHRDALARHLEAAGIGTACHYPKPLPAQPVFRARGYDPTAYPVAGQAAREVLSLPCFPELTDAEVERVVEAIHEFFRARPGGGDTACAS